MSLRSSYDSATQQECWGQDVQEEEQMRQEYIQDTLYLSDIEDDEVPLEYVDSWIPYPPPSPSATPNQPNVQQIMIGAGLPSFTNLHYPAASELNQHFCNLHPKDCLDRQSGLQARELPCTTNCSLEGVEATKSTLLSHVDLSGLGIALLVALLIFLGLHIGWDTEPKLDRLGKAGVNHSLCIPLISAEPFSGICRAQGHKWQKGETQLKDLESNGKH